MKKRVIVAMSGGVDSSVAALILKEELGYEVIGVTIKLTKCNESQLTDLKEKVSCCGWEGIDSAKKVAQTLGIPHYVLDGVDIFYEKVILYTWRSYLQGETPNPCVWCNRFLKFDLLENFRRQLEAHYISTGHYANIEKIGNSFYLKKGKDYKKDQSYFLYLMKEEELNRYLFPIGVLKKEDVRKIALRRGLSSATRPESQDICFPIFDIFDENKRSGAIVDTSYKRIGTHKGYYFYTVGQRRGLGIRQKKAYYIIRIAPKQNQIIVGSKKETFQDTMWVELHNWLGELEYTKGYVVKIRSRHEGSIAKIVEDIDQKYIKVRFEVPQQHITPGQIAVFYEGDIVKGGGKILNWLF